MTSIISTALHFSYTIKERMIILKVCVYAIAKNEEKFVSRWVESMREADEIYVLDTGSTDNTVALLQEFGVHVKTEGVFPWRFDVARNLSLDMVADDADICVCTDLDEVFDAGWRDELEKHWTKNTTHARYPYYWSIDKDGKPTISFYIEKIHARHGYLWHHPVHEVLKCILPKEEFITIDTITIKHYPDQTKSRSCYLPLLELSVLEDPTDDRNLHYLGREYMYYERWLEAIDTLKKHLDLKTATWKDERAASMRFIARCYQRLERYADARAWLDKAMKEAPYLRDAFVERALLEYQLKEYERVELFCFRALEIKTHQKSYINEPFSWDGTIYDLLAISAYELGRYGQALYFVTIALEYSPNDTRLVDNQRIFKEKESQL